MLVSDKVLDAAIPTNHTYAEWLPLCDELFPKYGITTPKRIAQFLANVGHESTDFKFWSENLNYSAERLVQVFPKYFTKLSSLKFAHDPVAIANRVYANRNGNGGEKSGDGYRFRGHGLIQITGRYNFQQFADFKKMQLLDVPQYLSTKRGALESACWFWETRKLNDFADRDYMLTIMKRINGGFNGKADRQARLARIFHAMSGK
jgi:putative chitinase